MCRWWWLQTWHSQTSPTKVDLAPAASYIPHACACIRNTACRAHVREDERSVAPNRVHRAATRRQSQRLAATTTTNKRCCGCARLDPNDRALRRVCTHGYLCASVRHRHGYRSGVGQRRTTLHRSAVSGQVGDRHRLVALIVLDRMLHLGDVLGQRQEVAVTIARPVP